MIDQIQGLHHVTSMASGARANNAFYHWGSIIVPPGYTDPLIFASGGNPYGASWVSGSEIGSVGDEVREAARYQGRRLAEYAERLVASRAAATA